MDNDTYKQIDRAIVTTATLMDMELDECVDPQEYDVLMNGYADLLRDYDLFEKPFVEDANESGLVDFAEGDDIAVIVTENGKYSVQESGCFCGLDAVYDYLEQIGESNLFKACYGGKYGIISLGDEMEIEIPFEYDSITVRPRFYLRIIVEKEKKFQYRCNGELEWVDEIIMPIYAGWIRVRQGDRIGWLDVNLNVTFDQAEAHEYVLQDVTETLPFVEKYCVVSRKMLDRCTDMEDRLRNCNDAERETLEEQLRTYSISFCESSHLRPFSQDGKMGVKDFLDGIIVPAIYDEIKHIRGTVEDTCFGRIVSRWGLVAEHGRRISSPVIEFDEPTHCFNYENWMIVRKDGKYGVYDSFKGEYLLEPIYDELIEKDGYCHIITRIGDRYGFFNSEFNIPPKYENYWIGRCLSFVRFMLDDKWGYIDRNGRWTDSIEQARAYVRNPMCFA